MRYLAIGILLIQGVVPAKATAVTDLIDLPIEIQDLLNNVQQVKVAIDQLIMLMDEYEHWKWQAKKLTRNGFRLRDLEAFLTQNTLSAFYGGSALSDLAQAIDGGGDPGEIAQAMTRVYPPAEPVEDWETGDFNLTERFLERVRTLQLAGALNYTGAVEAFSNVGKARTNGLENQEVYRKTMDLFENPQHGEQEAQDLLNVQLGQLVDLSTQEQAMLNGFGSSLASAMNQRLVQEKAVMDDTQTILNILTEMGRNTPEIQNDLSF